MKQRRFDNEVPQIINASESHMALVFLLDVSGSMKGRAIQSLNEGLERFKQEVCEDRQTREILDVAIIQFNDQFEVIQDFVPIEYMESIELQADGGTKYSEPIREALYLVNERSRFYRRSGSEPFKPWIIMITDGAPTDDITDVAYEVEEMQDKGKVRFIALGVGEYDPKPLKQITDVVFRMDGTNFSAFFDWVGKSMRSVSQSAPGEKAPLPQLEGNVYRDVSDI